MRTKKGSGNRWRLIGLLLVVTLGLVGGDNKSSGPLLGQTGTSLDRVQHSMESTDDGRGVRNPSTQAGISTSSRTPLGLPGEFEPQSALILGCNELVRRHPEVFAEVVAGAHRNVRVVGLVSDEDELDMAQAILKSFHLPTKAVHFSILPLDTMWVRDYGPFFVRRPGGVAVLDGEYAQAEDEDNRPMDDVMPQWLGEGLRLPVLPLQMRIDGGNLLTNGDGLCVTTTALIERNIARGHDAVSIEALLRKHLGIRQIVFLNRLEGEETGHVDMFLTFLAPNVAVVGESDPATDPTNARILDNAAAALAGQPTSLGPMKVYRIPMPPASDGVWRTYTNVIFANKILLVPNYSDIDHSLQRKAMDLYTRLLPGWKVVGVNADSLASEGGSLHCISLNVPKFMAAENLFKTNGLFAGNRPVIPVNPPAVFQIPTHGQYRKPRITPQEVFQRLLLFGRPSGAVRH